MKTAIYIEQGVTQLVLTPENDWEKSALANLGKGAEDLKVFRGSFFQCRGGWYRHDQDADDSIMLRLTPKASGEPFGEPVPPSHPLPTRNTGETP